MMRANGQVSAESVLRGNAHGGEFLAYNFNQHFLLLGMAAGIIPFRRSAAVLDVALDRTDYLIENRFTVTDIIVGYTVSWGETDRLLDGFENLGAYLDRLRTREHCTLPQPD